MTTQPIVVWAEIPVANLDTAARFYDTVFGYTSTVDRSGPQPMAVLNNTGDTVGANLFEGEAARGNIIHFGVPDSCEAAATRVTEAGGTVLTDPITIPPGRFIMALDLDGNQIGLFQPNAA